MKIRFLLTPILLLLADPSVQAVSFDEWRAQYFTAAQLLDSAVSGPHADPDGDGRGNFLEFALDSDPWVPTTGPYLVPGFTLDISTSLPHLSATFRIMPGREGIVIVPQVSDNLGTRWRADKVDLWENGYLGDGRLEYMAIDRDPANKASHRFIRLLIATDADQDGIPDAWELAYGLNPADPFDSMTDTDGDGDSNLTEFLQGTNPLNPNDNSQNDEAPRAPRNVSVVFNSDGTKDVIWEDGSDNEKFFVIFGTDGDGNKVELGRVGPNQTRFRLPPGY